MSFSVVIPFFNEEDNAETLLDEIDVNLKEINDDYEIILINDASTDNTYDVLKNIHKKNNKWHHWYVKNSKKGCICYIGVKQSNLLKS